MAQVREARVRATFGLAPATALSVFALCLLMTACGPGKNQVATAAITTAPALTETPTPRPSPTSSPTLIPCAPAISQPVPDHPEYVIHYDGCTLRDSETIETAFKWAIEAVPPGVQLSEFHFYFFDNNLEGLAEVENESRRRSGYDTSSVEEIKANWNSGGGESNPDGTVILYYGSWWNSQSRDSRMHSIVHEIHHQLQYSMIGIADFWNAKIPVWWVEGGAEYYSAKILVQHGATPAPDEPALEWCFRTLAELSDWTTLDGACIYPQAEKALYLLDQLFGEQKYLETLGVIRQYGFETAFERVYNMSVDEFDVLFQQYSDSGYKVLPNIPTVTKTP